ncbi:solute carrier family 23 protein [Escherichia coli]
MVPPRYFCFSVAAKSACLRSRNMLFLLPHWPASLQAFCGHRRAIMEGPGGPVVGNHPYYHPWRSIARTPIDDIATSLAVGLQLSGVLTMLIGFSGLGHRLARLFTPSVMVLFMLMLGAQLSRSVFEGSAGLPFGIADPNFKTQITTVARSRWR